jgi:hypothetical protein
MRMSKLNSSIVFVATMLVVSAAGGASSAADTEAGWVLVEAEPQRGFFQYPGYSLSLKSYDAATQTVRDISMTSAREMIQMGRRQNGRQFYATKLRPGTYAIQRVNVQGYWNVCFNGGTKTFEVKPGEVVYMGRFDPNPHLAEIGRLSPIIKSGEMQTVFDTPRPALTEPAQTPDWRPAAEAYVTSRPDIPSAPITEAAYADATFKTGRGMFMTLARICGGHWNRR